MGEMSISWDRMFFVPVSMFKHVTGTILVEY